MNAPLQAMMDFWMADSPEVRARCGALAGRCVVIELTDISLELALRPTETGIAVSVGNDESADARIRGTTLDLLRLSRGTTSGAATGKVHIEGDAELAQSMRALLRDVRVDPEERLARFIGDVPAHELGRLMREASTLMIDSATRLAGMMGEFLKHERRDLPQAYEVEQFVVAVDALRDDVERATARVRRLETQL